MDGIPIVTADFVPQRKQSVTYEVVRYIVARDNGECDGLWLDCETARNLVLMQGGQVLAIKLRWEVKR